MRAGHVQPLWAGHPWVFQQAIERIEGTATPGADVLVVDPNGKVRRWEIYFDPKEFGDDFPSQHEAMIDVEWPDSTYRIKVGIKPGNPIYFRSPAARVAGGQDTRVTDLCVKHGFGRVGEIRLQVVVPREKFRVVR